MAEKKRYTVRRPLVMAEGLRASRALRRCRGVEIEVPEEVAKKLAAKDPDLLEAAEKPREG